MTVVEGSLKALIETDRAQPKRIKLLVSSRFGQQLTEHANCFETIHVSPATEEIVAFVRSELGNPSCLSPWVNPELGRRFRQDSNLFHQIAERCVSEADRT